jgi:hypothetical protein
VGKGAKEPRESPQAEDTPSNDSLNTGETKEKVTQKVKHKKINSRRKLGNQTHAIVVTVPKEKEEIKEVERTK